MTNILILGGLSHLATNFIINEYGFFEKILAIDKYSYCSQSIDNISNIGNCIFIRRDANDVDIYEIAISHNIDIILNTAASTHVDKSYSDIDEFNSNNIKLVIHILEAMRKLKKVKKDIKLIHLSTDEVYGDCYNSPRKEQDSLNPTNPYSATKAAGDMLINSYIFSYNLDNIIILRPNNMVGPFQYPDKIVPLFVNKLSKGEPVTIHDNGVQKRCFISTEHLCHIIRVIIQGICYLDMPLDKKNYVYNVGYNCQAGISVNNIYNIIKTRLGSSDAKALYSKGRPYNDKLYMIDNSNLSELLSKIYDRCNHFVINMPASYDDYKFYKNLLLDIKKTFLIFSERSEDAIKLYLEHIINQTQHPCLSEQ